MRKILSRYDKFEEVVLVLSLVINVIIVFSQVIMRALFNRSLTWSEELSRYIFIWQIWLGTSIAFKENQHIKVDLIYNVVKSKKGQKGLQVFVNIIWITINVFMVYAGFKLLKSMASRNALSSGMRMPLVYIFAALPISSIMLVIRIIFDTIDLITGKREVNTGLSVEDIQIEHVEVSENQKNINESAKSHLKPKSEIIYDSEGGNN